MGIDRFEQRSKIDKGRVSGSFVALPVSVLKSAAYLGLSANARSLLLEVALQYHGDDNGRMLLSRAHLMTRGWKSSDMINKGKQELLESKLIFETVKGQRPNKASWYAVTWYSLGKLKGFDHGVQASFERGAYVGNELLAGAATLGSGRNALKTARYDHKGAVVNPPGGAKVCLVGPPCGTDTGTPAPPSGPIESFSGALPVPPDGHPLEMPSAGVRMGFCAPSLETALK